jgi:glycosyltransferase involved in cell wall biosynthesis
MNIIGFVQNQLCIRGTTVAMYDYACANEEILGNLSVIFYQKNHRENNLKIIEKVSKRFTLIEFEKFSDIENKIDQLGITHLYIIKYGYKDDYLSKKVPTLIHSVFAYDPHGKYTCVSKTIADNNNGIWLPHMIVPLEYKNGNLFRKTHNIPLNSYVYGRYGGKNTFSIDYIKDEIKSELNNHLDFWFVFVNTDKFIDHDRVLFLPEITDPIDKGAFIDGCDAMIHGRQEGETFGLAVAEFSMANLPVITCPATITQDNEHIRLLGGRGIIFTNQSELKKI